LLLLLLLEVEEDEEGVDEGRHVLQSIEGHQAVAYHHARRSVGHHPVAIIITSGRVSRSMQYVARRRAEEREKRETHHRMEAALPC
jgi:hypothetical protein